MAGQETDDLGRWPSIEHAYAFVMASYDWSLRRLDAQDARLRQIGMAAVTVTLGVSVAAGAFARDGRLEYWWLYAVGAGLGAIVTVAALIWQTLKHLRLASVQDLWDQNLAKDPMVFRKDQIFEAAKRQVANNQVIEQRGQLAIWLAIAFGIQVLIMAVWLNLNLVAAEGATPGAAFVCQSG